MKWSITIDMAELQEHERAQYNECYESCLSGEGDSLSEYMNFTNCDTQSNEFVARWAAIYLTAYRDALKELARRAK